MSEESRSQLKTYYETGDIPTEAQFENLIDSSPNIVDDSIMLGGNPTVTAFAGGGQANATILTALFSTVTVCASAGDSIRLPDAGAGRWVGVVNATPNACNIFPAAGSQIDVLGVNNPLSIASGERFLFASTGTNWASFSGN